MVGKHGDRQKALENKDNEELEQRLEELRTRHRDLDEAIDAMIEMGKQDMIQVQRLKKQKLALKDRINKIENALLPDIIA